MKGYRGRILRLNLSDRKISFIDTEEYEQWVGGHGIGSALFWNLVKDKTIDGFHERNVVTIMTSPLTGTIAPGGASRIEVQCIGVQSYPVGWFTRSNLGGRFGPMLKFAGWDGIVLEGKAEEPVWLDIRDQTIRFRDARGLWGLDTWETQRRIWKEVTGRSGEGVPEGDYGVDCCTNATSKDCSSAVICSIPSMPIIALMRAISACAFSAPMAAGDGVSWHPEHFSTNSAASGPSPSSPVSAAWNALRWK